MILSYCATGSHSLCLGKVCTMSIMLMLASSIHLSLELRNSASLYPVNPPKYTSTDSMFVRLTATVPPYTWRALKIILLFGINCNQESKYLLLDWLRQISTLNYNPIVYEPNSFDLQIYWDKRYLTLRSF